MRRGLPHLLLCLALAGGGAGCTQFPELDAVQTPGVAKAPYPDLLPMEALLNGAMPQAPEGTIATVEGRATGLRTRADRLQHTDIAPRNVDDRMARLRKRAEELREQ